MGSNFRQKFTASCYFFGCGLLIPASVYLGYSEKQHTSIMLYIIASSFLFIAAAIDLAATIKSKPKLGIDNLLTTPTPGPKYTWQLSVGIAIFYLLGGLLFLLGSILYWPDFSSSLNNYGTSVFRAGSCCYLSGSLMSMINLLRAPSKKSCCSTTMLWLYVLIQYMIGAICYILGGIFSQLNVGYVVEMWLVGSFLFTGGASVGLLLTLFKK
jgi:hypothetical protein